MNNYGTMEEEKKSTVSSFADKLKSFASKAQRPGAAASDPKFDSLTSKDDLEGNIKLSEDGGEQAAPSQGSSFLGNIGASLTSAKSFVIGREEPEPQGWLRVFNFLPNEKSYTYAIIAFITAGLFGFLSFFMLTMIVLSPDKFVLFFTLTTSSLLTAFAFLKGPRTYVKSLFVEKNLYASIALLSSIVLSLYFSIIAGSYLWSLLFTLIELNCVLFFFCKMGISLTQVKWVCSTAWSTVSGRFK